MRFTCPSCSKAYRLSQDRLGASGQAKIRCPNCKKVVRVRNGEGEELVCELSTTGAHQPAKVAPPRSAGPTTGRRPALSTPAADPPVWHVAVNKKAQGPMSVAKVGELIASGVVNGGSLAWRKGQTGWKKVTELSELSSLLKAAPVDPATPPTKAPRKTEPASAAAKRGPKPNKATARASAPARPKASGHQVAKTVKSAAAEADNMLADDAPAMTAAAASSQSSQLQHSQAATGSTKPNPRPLIDQLNEGRVKATTGAEAPPGDLDDDSPTMEQDIPALTSDGSLASKPGGRDAKAPEMAKPKGHTGTKTGRRGRKRRGGDKSGDRAATSSKKKGKGGKAAARLDQSTKKSAPPVPPSDVKLPPKPVRDARTEPKAAAKATPASDMQAAAQSANFFETGETFMADVDFTLPDPNKHKPTKEEYNDLLQEFSVMFRLDKRTKRQKWVIGGVLAGLLVGVIAFGVILVVQGDKRHRLIRDSKTILAVFSLPYQTSVTVRMGGDGDGDETPGAAARGQTRSTSVLANRLRRKIRKKRVASVKMRADGKVALMGGKRKAYVQPSASSRLTKAQLLAQKAAAKRALEDALKRSAMGGRTERGVKTLNIKTDVTKSQLRALCSNNMERLYRCAQQHAGGAMYTAVLNITDAGRIGSIKAMIEGSRNAAVSNCARAALSKVKYGVQSKARTHRCQVGG